MIKLLKNYSNYNTITLITFYSLKSIRVNESICEYLPMNDSEQSKTAHTLNGKYINSYIKMYFTCVVYTVYVTFDILNKTLFIIFIYPQYSWWCCTVFKLQTSNVKNTHTNSTQAVCIDGLFTGIIPVKKKSSFKVHTVQYVCIEPLYTYCAVN